MKSKAVVMRGFNDLVIDEIEIYEPIGDEVLIKIDVAAVCGSDAHQLIGKDDEATFPYVPGHEWSGHIVQVGDKVKTLKVGDRVTGDVFIPCRKCYICRNHGIPHHCKDHRSYGFEMESPGGMSEYHLSPEERIYKIPDSISDELGAIIEPITVGYSAIFSRGGGLAPHDRVLITGAGPIGLIAIGIALITKAQVIVIEPQPRRIEMAKEMGAEIIIDPNKTEIVEEVMRLTNSQGATKIIECSASREIITKSVDMIAEDGIIVLVGLSAGVKHTIEMNKIIWNNSKIIGSCGAPFFFPNTITFLSKKLVNFEKIITERFSFEDALEAFNLCNKSTAGKILLYPDAAKIPSKSK
jgi:2-desacetyl-2-hydroxyethyl bacteriochlorophyllide A dehydrogenase